MIDLGRLRDEPKKTSELIKRKDPSFNVEKLIEQDKQVRQLKLHAEKLRHHKNELAIQGKKGITFALREQSIVLGNEIKQVENELSQVEKSFTALYLSCPNIPQEDIPIGDKDQNKVIKKEGQKPLIPFEIKNHVELGINLGWFDFEAAARIAGSHFALYKNDAVRLIYALTMFMLENNQKHGFSPILPPYVVNEKSLEITGNFPKFKEDVYHIGDEDLYLLPTSEVSLVSMYRDHIFASEELPMRLTSWTSCFRREAGGYGATERGLIRMHEFEKVELVTLCAPEESSKEQLRMIACAEEILQKLGLTYRISLLATQDCSFASARTYDLEVWMPGQDAYYEVSSVSNCTDFQARRGSIRYRKTGTSKPELVNTLNGSSLALSRLMVALMETYQQSDGTVEIPSILKNYGVW
jgi:seryl-tRNA synthetase